MKYLLILFHMTPGTWPVQGVMGSQQHGPFSSLIACESAGARAEAIMRELGAQKTGFFCANTNTDWKVRTK